jgi:hypothetical protein
MPVWLIEGAQAKSKLLTLNDEWMIGCSSGQFPAWTNILQASSSWLLGARGAGAAELTPTRLSLQANRGPKHLKRWPNPTSKIFLD